MGASIKTIGSLPRRVWDVEASREVALSMRAAVVDRASVDGLDVDDKPFRPYSTKPMAVLNDSDTGRRMKPKGGIPVYSRGAGERAITGRSNPFRVAEEEAFSFDRVGRPGRTRAESRGRVIIGRRYPGGYAQFKRESRRGLTSAGGRTGVEVNLILSGQMMRSFKQKTVALYMIVLGLTGDPVVYGTYVNRNRNWIGLSPSDLKTLDVAAFEAVKGAMARSLRGPR